jgi:tetratricopeptide (TPR) repeat protein
MVRRFVLEDFRSDNRRRSLLIFMLAALAPLACPAGFLEVQALAQASDVKPTSLIGKDVVPKSSNFALKVDGQLDSRKQVFRSYIVERADKDGLLLRSESDGVKGRASASDVVSLEKAVDFFTEQIHKNPNDQFSYFARAAIRAGYRQEYDLALSDLGQSIRLNPSAEAYLDRGLIWQSAKKDYDKAIADYDRATQLDPKNVFVLTNRGLAWYMKGEFDKAIADYDRAIQLDPKNAAVFNDRGLARFVKQDYDKAIADFDEAIRLEPKRGMFFSNRGRTRLKKEEYDKAIADLDEAIRLDPKQAESFLLRGIGWLRKKEFDKAIADYDQAIRLDPNNGSAFSLRGHAFKIKKEYDKAITDYERAIHLEPKNASHYYYRAMSEFLAGRDADSVGGMKPALAKLGWREKYSAYWAIIGYFAARRAGKMREARALLDEFKAKGDTTSWPSPVIRYLRGEIDAGALMAASTDNDKRTESHCYVGLDLLLKHKPAAAKDHFLWVTERGNQGFNEYEIVQVELERMDKAKRIGKKR